MEASEDLKDPKMGGGSEFRKAFFVIFLGNIVKLKNCIRVLQLKP